MTDHDSYEARILDKCAEIRELNSIIVKLKDVRNQETDSFTSRIKELEDRLTNMLCLEHFKTNGLYAVGTCVHCLGVKQESIIESQRVKIEELEKRPMWSEIASLDKDMSRMEKCLDAHHEQDKVPLDDHCGYVDCKVCEPFHHLKNEINFNEVRKENKELRGRIEIVEKALEFYANEPKSKRALEALAKIREVK